ncbi:MAG: hypothetical protein ACLGIG_09295 [Actinomycetes bacterium]
MQPAAPPGTARAVAGAAATVLAAALLCLPTVRDAEPPTPPTGQEAAARAASLGVTVWPGAASPDHDVAVDIEPVPPAPAAPAQAPLPTATAAPARVPVQHAPAPPTLERRARAALEALDYPWPELGFDIHFAARGDSAHLGFIDPQARTITVLVRPEQSDLSLRATVAHEIGHAVDIVTGSDEQRARYRQLRGLSPATPWWPCDLCSDYRSGAGDWAEVFAYWLVGPGDFRSELAGPPDDRALQDIAELFTPPSARVPAGSEPQPAKEQNRSPRPSSSPSPSSRPVLPDLP